MFPEAAGEVPSGTRLEPFLDRRSGANAFRMREFVVQDLIGSVLVPAGAARAFDNNTFALLPDVLEQVRVGTLAENEVQAWFDRLRGPLN
jgi:hypothetical protein